VIVVLLWLALTLAVADEPPAPVAEVAEVATVDLITAEEAAAPDAARKRGGFRELSDGPVIQIESPDTSGASPSPFPITVLFLPGTSGKAPDPASLQVTYVKLIGIDITGRVAPFVSAEGVRMPSAKVPAGTHTLRVTLADTAGNLSAKELTFTVAN
jgi:hypothetical protein